MKKVIIGVVAVAAIIGSLPVISARLTRSASTARRWLRSTTRRWTSSEFAPRRLGRANTPRRRLRRSVVAARRRVRPDRPR